MLCIYSFVFTSVHSHLLIYFKCVLLTLNIIFFLFSACFQKVEQLCNKGIKKVSCGTQFSVALACDGHVYTFGQGTFPFENGM